MSNTDSQPRKKDGQFTTRMSLEDVLAGMTVYEPYTASELGDKLGLPRTTTNYYLNQLHNQGEVQKKKFHATRVVWMKTP
ncbi:helix-turn-helix domain-containing protein [Haloferax marisrubri]|uniref:ArsR family transcriptional regulator n=1 Tax=Haloferax marisrubri TaxID=1544719 RepID=A0A2P4NUH6_9EURY|nr:helix-turn-helix transcriptional regulator [Haloferax marisrubri]POG56791.1 ArsR family transcriptional regulator [Haloferax marisrubri]